MIISGLRWGSSRNGKTGNTRTDADDVELRLLDDGQDLFVSICVCDSRRKIYVSRVTLFDLLTCVPGMENEEIAWGQVRPGLIGEIELEEDGILRFSNEDPLEEYWRAIHSARLCMQAYLNHNVTDNADEFIKRFLGRDIDECYVNLFEEANREHQEDDAA